MSLIRPVDVRFVDFVAYACASELIQKQIRDVEYGATKKGLGLEDVKSIVIPLPTMKEQSRIVEMLQRRLSVANKFYKPT